MKSLLLLVGFCIISVALHAQKILKQELSQKEIDAVFKNYFKRQPEITLRDTTIELMNKNLLMNQRRPGVYRLRQDGMPCVVPDTKEIVAMPNAWKGTITIPYRTKAPGIPNPALPNIETDTK